MTERDPEGHETRWLDEFVDLRGRRVLEIGSGDGRLTWRIAAKPRWLAGIDMDPALLAEACRTRDADLVDRVAFVTASADQLPFASQSFDAVLLAWSL